MPATEFKYEAVPDDEEQHITLNKITSQPLVAEQHDSLPVLRFFSAHPGLIWLGHGLLLCLSLSVLAVSLCLHLSHSPRYGSNYFPYCEFFFYNTSQFNFLISYAAPAETVASYHNVRYNITPALERTEYVGFGQDVDQAWEHITYDVGDQMITHDELQRLGLDPTSLKVTNPRTGKVGYRAGIQVFHKLHCLNLLRQETYKEYYSHTGGDIDVEPEDLRGHLGMLISHSLFSTAT
jgi:hypothetical protein